MRVDLSRQAAAQRGEPGKGFCNTYGVGTRIQYELFRETRQGRVCVGQVRANTEQDYPVPALREAKALGLNDEIVRFDFVSLTGNHK